MNTVQIDVDETTGRAHSIERVEFPPRLKRISRRDFSTHCAREKFFTKQQNSFAEIKLASVEIL